MCYPHRSAFHHGDIDHKLLNIDDIFSIGFVGVSIQIILVLLLMS